MVWNQYVYEAMNGNEAYNSDNEEIIEQNEKIDVVCPEGKLLCIWSSKFATKGTSKRFELI